MEMTLEIRAAATGAPFAEADDIGFRVTAIELAQGLAAGDSEDEEEDDDDEDEDAEDEDEGQGEGEGQ